MLGSLFGLAGDVIKVATAPISVAADMARTVTQPTAAEVEALVKELKEFLNQESK